MQSFYWAQLRNTFNLQEFPFDQQSLQIVLGMRSNRDKDKAFAFDFCEIEAQVPRAGASG